MEPPIKAAIVPVTPFQQNCSIVWCTATNRGAVVDPGGDLERVDQALVETGCALEKVLVTHGHLDHCAGVAEFAERHGLPVEGPHRDDKFWIDMVEEQARQFGLSGGGRPFTPDRWLDDGDRATVGDQSFEVFHCPGHTPGHVVFFHRGARLAIVGDVLFRGSIGRTDFPRGDHAALIASITNKLWPLGEDVAFIPGHGPMSTFGAERKTNAFVSDLALGTA